MVRTGFDKKTVLVAVALLAVWICWGATYLAIKFAVQSIPPMFMAGARFLAAGAIMYAVARFRGAPAPRRSEWFGAAGVGLLLLIGGNGGVVLSAKMVPSGLTALLVATAPLWIVLLNWLWLGNTRPGAITWAGLALGLAGIGLLTGGDSLLPGDSPVNPFWAGILTAAAFCWGLGSVYSRKATLPESAVMSTALQMLTGGGAFLLLGLAVGESAQLSIGAITLKSVLSILYLVVFGSLVGFSAYVWLLQNTSPVLVSTYAYVNPLVAILLGSLLDGEAVGFRTVVSAMVILLSVIMITAQNAPAKAGEPAEPADTAAECGKA